MQCTKGGLYRKTAQLFVAFADFSDFKIQVHFKIKLNFCRDHNLFTLNGGKSAIFICEI